MLLQPHAVRGCGCWPKARCISRASLASCLGCLMACLMANVVARVSCEEENEAVPRWLHAACSIPVTYNLSQRPSPHPGALPNTPVSVPAHATGTPITLHEHFNSLNLHSLFSFPSVAILNFLHAKLHSVGIGILHAAFPALPAQSHQFLLYFVPSGRMGGLAQNQHSSHQP